MTDIARVLQSVQHAYQRLTEKKKSPSEWKEIINKKIATITRNKNILLKHKGGKEKPTKDELKAARRLMGERKLTLDKPKDTNKMISLLEERIQIYESKSINHQNKKKRIKNDKFELYRGKFYRDPKGEKIECHELKSEEIKEW